MMGYAYYEIKLPASNRILKRGYGVHCKCHFRGCNEQIDRGLSYLCYNCTWYFCGKHTTQMWDPREGVDNILEIECFAGESSQVCQKCEVDLLKFYKQNPSYLPPISNDI